MIQLVNVSLAFSARVIFNNLSWHLKPQKKIGLFGPNGTGKTTLLDLIAGVRVSDSGLISKAPSINIGYLPQEVHEENTGRTVIEEAIAAYKEVSNLEQEVESITDELKKAIDSNSGEYKKLLSRLDAIQIELTTRDAHRIQYEAEKLLMGLGFETDELTKPLSTFSGGWRMRVALAKLLLQKPDVVLLDEPTNHLDIESIAWLENYLKTFQGAVVLVSHDPYFLNRVVDAIAELVMGQITEYTGNYSFYIRERESRVAMHKSAYGNQQRQIRDMERFIERFRYKASKARQVQSQIKMLEKMELIPPPHSDDPSIHFRFPEPPRSGRTVLELSTFSKSYSDKNCGTNQVFTQAGPLLVERGDKTAIAGKNGAGKSTLARILLGTEPFEGNRLVGYNVEITYFAQHQAESLNPSNTIVDELESRSKGQNETQIRSLLGAFLFTGDDVFKPVGILSGGEKSRVALAKTLLSPTNFMILDEPTNHLDIQSKNILIEALKQYTGTFVVVSHDRHFLDQIVNKVWYVEHGEVHMCFGNYSDCKYHLSTRGNETQQIKDAGALNNNNSYGIVSSSLKTMKPGSKFKEDKRRVAEERNRKYREIQERGIENIEDWRQLSLKQLHRALADLEEKIKAMEDRKTEIERLLQNPEFYMDKELSYEVTSEYNDLQNSLKALYERWESITSHLEPEVH
ncbi:MAG: ABC-F family ATP-binding cassette domain-containing protein [Deltaproteobacteria bacterium]|nr:ABC-F family ATP-binding cassette domain-containing protein [Deltaproteobacteria bacterium]